MHYYKFNIGDYCKKTAHLKETEDLVYRRILDFYYDTEKGIQNDSIAVARLIRMPTRSKVVEAILAEFFFLAEDGRWHQAHCDDEIVNFQKFSEQGKIGVQVREANKLNKSMKNAKPPIRGVCQTLEATTNHKPITNNQDKTKPPTPLPDWLPRPIWEDFINHRKSMKRPMTARAQELAIASLDGFRKNGHDPTSIIHKSIVGGWQGLFEPKETVTKTNGSRSPPKETYSDMLREVSEAAIRNSERTHENEIY